METDKLLENLFDKKILNILRLFLNKTDQDMTLQEISKYSKVPIASALRILRRLVIIDVIEVNKTKHLKVYRLKINDKSKYLSDIFQPKKTILDEFVERVNKIAEVRRVILHGREEKDKANLLLIGEGVDNSLVRDIIIDIKTRFGFSITHLVLTESQYNQMAAMNLYSGKKEILLEK